MAGHNPGAADERTAPQRGGHKPREIVIRCAGPSKPWIIWLEIVFIEWSESSFSVYARTGEAIPGGAVSLGPLPRTAGRLSWREALAFVQSHNLAAMSSSDPQPIDIYGVRPWQKDIIAAAMMRLSAIVPFLARLPEKELKPLHDRLGGFLSENSIHLLSRFAAVTSGALPQGSLSPELLSWWDRPIRWMSQGWRRTMRQTGLTRLLKGCLRDTATPQRRLRGCSNLITGGGFDVPGCAGLFELWLRTEPKPKGGLLYCGIMDNELPVLYWLLRERAAEVFQSLVGTHHKALEEFVSWFLDKAHPYDKYFTGRYNYTSSTVYTYGRPSVCCVGHVGQRGAGCRDESGNPVSRKLTVPGDAGP